MWHNPSIDSARVAKRGKSSYDEDGPELKQHFTQHDAWENPKYQTNRYLRADTMPLCSLCHLFSYINVTPVSYSSVFTHSSHAYGLYLALVSLSWLLSLFWPISSASWQLCQKIFQHVNLYDYMTKSWSPPPNVWGMIIDFGRNFDWIKQTTDWTIISSYPDHLQCNCVDLFIVSYF